LADFLSDNTTWLAVVLGLVAVAYGIGLTVYLAVRFQISEGALRIWYDDSAATLNFIAATDF
jgi:hypothetical protein